MLWVELLVVNLLMLWVELLMLWIELWVVINALGGAMGGY